jgi:hypothetical protein
MLSPERAISSVGHPQFAYWQVESHVHVGALLDRGRHLDEASEKPETRWLVCRSLGGAISGLRRARGMSVRAHRLETAWRQQKCVRVMLR